MNEHIWAADAWQLADSVRSGALKAVELLDVCLERIGRHDAAINSFVVIDPDAAHLQAQEVDRLVSDGEDPGPLAGIPVGVKDLENVEGLPTRYGSLLYDDSPAMYDSTQVARLRDAGAVILGKTTTPELGSIAYTASKLSGITRNPWNLERTPGGSSGGSAAAVAAGLVPLATASDGGGSIRIPASFTGLPGLKPTYGLIPRGPGRLGTSHLSCYGPMARSVRDIARYLDVVVGSDPMDPMSIPDLDVHYEEGLGMSIDGLRAVWSSDLGFGLCDPEVERIARGAADVLLSATGMREVDFPVNLPDIGMVWAVAETLDCYADLDIFWPNRSDEMTPVIKLAMQIAESLQPSHISEAAKGRHEVLRLVNEIFEEVDLILTPATPTVAFDADGPMPTQIGGRFVNNPLVAICFTYPFNLTGHPAMSIPAGFNSEGLPVGLQMIGPRLSEPRLLAAAKSMESARPWPRLARDYS